MRQSLALLYKMKTIGVTRFGGKLANIYRKQGGKCNEVDCSVSGIRNLTRDHIIPIAVAKLYGWSKEMYEAEENLQLICPIHHYRKDKRVNQRLDKIKYRKEILQRIHILKDELTKRV